MSSNKWMAGRELISLFQNVGKVALLSDMEDTHSGNLAVFWVDEEGHEKMVITSTGSQKGDLKTDDICFISRDETDFGYYKASSESDIHARILRIPGVRASMHCHTKQLTIVTMDDEPKPNSPKPFIPVDPLGFYHCEGNIPVIWVAVPSGSPEMTKAIPDMLASHPVTALQFHGAFSRARTLPEAFFLGSVAESSGLIVRMAGILDVDVDALRRRIQTEAEKSFFLRPAPYTIDDDDICEFPQETELIQEFRKTGARIFESRLSPFHTGSFSVRGVRTMFYAPKASMPREIGGPLLDVPLTEDKNDSDAMRLHKIIYRETDFQTVMHCFIPEAEAHSHFIYPGEEGPLQKMVAVDAEGSFLYLVVPVLPSDVDTETFLRNLHDYKVVLVRGGGVWGVGAQ
ncbi:MAG: class II aldolase/adducin family protein [Candidatus Aminicenantes bacterium]|nr:class II aldolase/adducin family protein [Candidatus Aminicenantes bacterium]